MTLAKKTEPKQERAQRTYHAILDCVEAMLLKNPDEKLTPRAVVQATGIPQGTVYRYFADVAEMRDALFERYMTRFQHDVSSVFEAADLPDVGTAMETLFEMILGLNRGNPALLGLSLDPTTQSRVKAVAHQRELIATAIADALVRGGLIGGYDKGLLDEIYLCVLISASLTKEAFLWDPEGDGFVIESGRELLRRQADHIVQKATSTGAASTPKRMVSRPGPRYRQLKNYRRATAKR